MRREGSLTRPDISLVQRIAEAAMGAGIAVEVVDEGVSTFVYRLVCGNEVLYLRILPEDDATFAPEAAAHTVLQRKGVRVPLVVYWENRNKAVNRSVMITTEIAGTQIWRGEEAPGIRDILRDAGRDLAVMNSVPVAGFGWVRRDVCGCDWLRADFSTERDFMLADLDPSLHILTGTVLEPRECDLMRDGIFDHTPLLDATQAHLAHGDFDVTHIYCDAGRYAGVIDLGEIRGTGPYYDLGHFRFHDGETLHQTLSPYLLAGYLEITPLPPDADRRITFASLLIGIHFLARTYDRLTRSNRVHALTTIRRDLKVLAE